MNVFVDKRDLFKSCLPRSEARHFLLADQSDQRPKLTPREDRKSRRHAILRRIERHECERVQKRMHERIGNAPLSSEAHTARIEERNRGQIEGEPKNENKVGKGISCICAEALQNEGARKCDERK